jgi:hypothetical protein
MPATAGIHLFSARRVGGLEMDFGLRRNDAVVLKPVSA